MNHRSQAVQAGSRHEASSKTLRGRPLLLARAAWVALAAFILGLNAAGIPYAYALHRQPCTGAACVDSGRLTSEGFQAVQQLGISPEFYAAYVGFGIQTVVMLVFFTLAAVIFWRRSEERMALFGSFMLLIFGGAAITGTMRDLAEVHSAYWFPVHLLDYIGQVSFGIFFYLFPNGRFVPSWTRWLTLGAALGFVPITFFPDSLPDALAIPFFFGFLGTLMFAQIYRYRRVSTQVQRQQTKWVVFGFSAALAGFLGTILLYNTVPAIGSAGPLGQMVGETVVYGFLLLIPLSIGVAILRSRLYDIDLIINRTLVYGSLTAMLVALYLGGVTATQATFRTLTGQEEQPQLAIVVSTLAIAALFNPLRRRIQSFIDRRFYRRKYDAAKILGEFSSRLRDKTDLDALNQELVEVTRETMQPSHLSVWLRPGTPHKREERADRSPSGDITRTVRGTAREVANDQGTRTHQHYGKSSDG